MEIHGLDSETPEGELAMLATEKEWIEPKTFDEVAQFLLRGRESKLYWTYNLRFDATAIIKLLPQEIWAELWNEPFVVYHGYKIRYIPQKLLSIGKLNSRGKTIKSAKLYDAAQYYMGSKLNDAAKKYLGMEKMEGDFGAKLGKAGGKKFYYNKKEEIIKYCMQDARLAKELGKYIVDKFVVLGFDGSNPVSSAAISAKYVRNHFPYPRIDVIPDMLHGLAQASYRGGMFQSLQRGYFDMPLYDYDINSAYPYEMMKLPNWSNGKFDVCDEPTKEKYGWYMCKFDCPHIPYDSKKQWKFCYSVDEIELDYEAQNSKIYYPKGKRQQAITKIEYEWMKEKGYPCEFLFGVEWKQNKDKYPSPFGWMDDFYYKRQAEKEAGNFGIQYTMKIILNGLYGKTVEIKHGIGSLTNFFYGSYITAGVRVRMAEILHNHPNEIINIATDGLVSIVKLPELKVSNKLGDWEIKEYTKGLFLGSGMYQVWKKDGSYYTKARGVTDKRDWDMLGAIKENKDKAKLEFHKVRPLQLGEILTHHKKLKPEMLNHFVEVGRKLDVNTDRNHKWNRMYLTFAEFLAQTEQATPLDVEEIIGGDM